MVTPTSRFALDTFDPGESWDHTDTVQFVDEKAVERDVIANRPASGTYDGELFLATDEGILYQWDGTNTQWNVILETGTDQAIDLIDLESDADLPDPSTLTKPTIAYIDSEDGYVGIFQA